MTTGRMADFGTPVDQFNDIDEYISINPFSVRELRTGSILSTSLPIEERRPWFEAKMLIIGEQNAGKTTLTQLICESNSQNLINEGQYIKRAVWKTLLEDNREVTVNVWDFDSNNARICSRLFVGGRSLYVIVLDATKPDHATLVREWLGLLLSRDTTIPIFIVVNKIDLGNLFLNQNQLRNEFDAEIEFAEVSCKNRYGLQGLLSKLRRRLSMYDYPNISGQSNKVFNQINSLNEGRGNLTISEFNSLCKASDITSPPEQQEILDEFHASGILHVLHDENENMEHILVRDPNWLVTGVLAVMSSLLNTPENPLVSRNELSKLLAGEHYAEDEFSVIFRAMINVGLCFRTASRGQYFTPESLRLKPLNYWNAINSKGLYRRYHFNANATMVFWQLMSPLSSQIDWQVSWRYGMSVFVDGVQVQISVSPETQKLYLAVFGDNASDREKVLNKLTILIEQISEKLALSFHTFIPIQNDSETVIPIEHVQRLRQLGELEFVPYGASERISVETLLFGQVQVKTPTNKELLQRLTSQMTMEELQQLCFELGVHHQNLEHQTQSILAMSLIKYCQHRDQMRMLISEIRQKWPHVLIGLI